MTEELSLPEPAAGILARTHAILDQHVTPYTPGREGWALGGGTLLSARWKHRRSTDLDLHIHPDTGLALLQPEHNPELWRKMKAAGATRIELENPPTIHFREGRIELLRTRPTPLRQPRYARFESGVAKVLGTAQVLTAKLKHRRLFAPVRDLYDIAVSARTEPAETAVAVNSLDGREFGATRARWLARKPLYERDAREELVGVPEEYEGIQSDPAAHAASVLKAARYHMIDVRVTGNAIIVQTANETTRQQHVYRTVRDARTGFEELGINAALHSRGWNPGDIRNEANNALDRGADAVILCLTGDETSSTRTPPNEPDRERTIRSRRRP